MMPTFRDWSVPVKNDWEMVSELTLSAFVKMGVDSRQVEETDVLWAGTLFGLVNKFNKVSGRVPKPLPIAADVNFFNLTTSADETMQALMEDHPDVDVLGTDHILACLIAAGRSVYSWDILISKIGGKVGCYSFLGGGARRRIFAMLLSVGAMCRQVH